MGCASADDVGQQKWQEEAATTGKVRWQTGTTRVRSDSYLIHLQRCLVNLNGVYMPKVLSNLEQIYTPLGRVACPRAQLANVG